MQKISKIKTDWDMRLLLKDDNTKAIEKHKKEVEEMNRKFIKR